MNCGDDRDSRSFGSAGLCRRKRSAWEGNLPNAKLPLHLRVQSMNETHRGCRSPGGFFFALIWPSGISLAPCIPSAQALPSHRRFVTMQARKWLAPGRQIDGAMAAPFRQVRSMTMQSIAGVSPPSVMETTVMTVWPSVASTSLGKMLGRLFRIKDGFGPVSVGRLALLACTPIGLMLYLSLRLPWAIQRYRLTNRRVIVERGVNARIQQFVDFDKFDSIELVVEPGQEWYAAGDLVFRKGAVETFRLPGVSRPESFRQTCLKVQQSYRSVAAHQPPSVGAA